MEEEVFEIELIPPEPGDIEWTAKSFGEVGYGDSAAEAFEQLGIDDLVEDAEYYRIHAPGVYGHPPGGQVSEGQQGDGLQLSERQRGETPAPVHKTDPPQDSV